MATVTPIQTVPIPSGGDAPNTSTQIAAAVAYMEDRLNMRFASEGTRDAAIPVASRKRGMVSFLNTTGSFWAILVDGGLWVPFGAADVWRGGTGFMVGAAPPAGTLKIVIEDTAVVTLNSAGAFAHALPIAFPNGIVTAVYVVGESPHGSVRLTTSTSTLNAITGNVTLLSTGLAAGAGGCRVNYRVVGW